METPNQRYLTKHDRQFWTSDGLAPDCSLGESIRDWSQVPVGLPIVLVGKDLPAIGGRVDSKMEDGSAMWIRDETWDRRLIHREDGYMIRVVIRWPSISAHRVP